MEYRYIYTTMIGPIGIVQKQCSITEISLSPCWRSQTEETPLLKKTSQELFEYLSGNRTTFSVPLSPYGTPFQRQVWNALCDIPYGETRSYGEVASIIGNPKASRAVGMANHKNPIAILIPCHRVIGADKRLVGYGGGIDIKKRLLDLEGAYYKD